MGLAAWPFTTRFGTGLAAGLGAARFQPAAISGTTASASTRGDLLTDFDQHLPWAHGRFSHRAVWPKSQVGVCQQNLQRQQGSLEFTVNESHCAWEGKRDITE